MSSSFPSRWPATLQVTGASEVSLRAGNSITRSRASADPGRTGARTGSRHLLSGVKELGLFVTQPGPPTDADAATSCHPVQESCKTERSF